MVGFVSNLAIFFIIWWTVLFAMLPIGLRTQDEDGEVTLGTTSSAPRGPHVRWAVLRTTIVSLVIFGIYYLVVHYWGFSFEDVPRIGPKFY